MTTHFAQASDWKLEKQASGVTAYTAEVAKSNFRAYRVEAAMKSTLSGMIALQKDAPSFPQWMDGVKSSKLIKEEGPSYFTQTLAPAPWPVKDRDSVVCSTISQDSTSKIITINFESQNELVPLQKGCERVASVKGFWEFTPSLEGMLKLVYSSHVNPGGNIPGWLANKFAIDVPFNTILNMLKVIQSPKYQQAVIEGIEELIG